MYTNFPRKFVTEYLIDIHPGTITVCNCILCGLKILILLSIIGYEVSQVYYSC